MQYSRWDEAHSKMVTYRCLGLAALAVFVCLSCVSVSADTEFRQDGAGTISVEYRVSRLVESLGMLSEPAPGLPLPVTRAGMDNLVNSIRGLTLTSYSSKENEVALTIRASFTFSDTAAFAAFMQKTGQDISFERVNRKQRLTLRLVKELKKPDEDIKKLGDAVFNNDVIALRFKLPATPSAEGGTVNAQARTASFSVPTAQLLNAAAPLTWVLEW